MVRLIPVPAATSRTVSGALLLKDGQRALSWSGKNPLRLWDITAGQGAGIWEEVDVIRGVVLDRRPDSCELVLFMLMVLPSRDAHHA